MSAAPPTAEEAGITEKLAKDRPTIDAADKSFMSLLCARSMSASATDISKPSHGSNIVIGLMPSNGNQQVLQFSRVILKSVNGYKFPIHCTVASTMAEKPGTSAEKRSDLLELSICSQLWNGLVQSNQKPSRFLGRIALKAAWNNKLKEDIENKLQQEQQQAMADEVMVQQQTDWLTEFERLLFHVHDESSLLDDDSELIWGSDNGQAELTRRKERRQSSAKERGSVTPS